ncbi:MAG: hypothetical protein Q4G00_10140 [Clostridia bacterium]|nr:hypothetical protein [Clostridia bacterium]
MKILVNRSLALLLTLVLLFTMMPFTVLAEAAEMDEAMDILETNEADDPEIMDNRENETDVPDEDGFEDYADAPDVEDDWIDWYKDDSDNGDEMQDSWETEEFWEESSDLISVQGEDALTLEDAIALRGYAYALTRRETKVYQTRNLSGDSIFTITEEDSILLVTECQHQSPKSTKVWFMGDDSPMTGYISPYDLKEELLTDDEVDAYTDLYWWDWVETEAGEMCTFYVSGFATVSAQEYPNEEWVDDSYSETEIASNESDESEAFVDDEEPEDEETIEEVTALRSAVRGISLAAVQSASSFTGSETIRLGKESSNITGIFLQNNGSQSTSIARHWVTVNGTEYTAFCIEASKSATSGRDGNVESSTDAGLQWIMIR